MAMAGSFKADVLPMFTSDDIQHMKRYRVKLDNYTWMSDPENAKKVYKRVEDGSMPPEGPPWSAEKLKVLSDWMNVDPKYQP
jgi:hypothetical protein